MAVNDRQGIGQLTDEDAAMQQEMDQMAAEMQQYSRMKRGDYDLGGDAGQVKTGMSTLESYRQQALREGATAAAALPGGLEDLVELGGSILTGDKGFNVPDVGQGISDYLRKQAKRIDIDPNRQEDLGTKVAGAIGQVGGYAVGGGGVGVAAKLARLGKVGTGIGKRVGGMGTAVGAMNQEADALFEKANGRPPTPEERNEMMKMVSSQDGQFMPEGTPVGTAAQAAIEYAPLELFARTLNKAKGGIGKVIGAGVTGALVEGTEEATQTSMMDQLGKEIGAYEESRDALEDMSEAATVGGLAGGIINATMATLGIATKGAKSQLATKVMEKQNEDLARHRAEQAVVAEKAKKDADTRAKQTATAKAKATAKEGPATPPPAEGPPTIKQPGKVNPKAADPINMKPRREFKLNIPSRADSKINAPTKAEATQSVQEAVAAVDDAPTVTFAPNKAKAALRVPDLGLDKAPDHTPVGGARDQKADQVKSNELEMEVKQLIQRIKDEGPDSVDSKEWNKSTQALAQQYKRERGGTVGSHLAAINRQRQEYTGQDRGDTGTKTKGQINVPDKKATKVGGKPADKPGMVTTERGVDTKAEVPAYYEKASANIRKLRERMDDGAIVKLMSKKGKSAMYRKKDLIAILKEIPTANYKVSDTNEKLAATIMHHFARDNKNPSELIKAYTNLMTAGTQMPQHEARIQEIEGQLQEAAMAEGMDKAEAVTYVEGVLNDAVTAGQRDPATVQAEKTDAIVEGFKEKGWKTTNDSNTIILDKNAPENAIVIKDLDMDNQTLGEAKATIETLFPVVRVQGVPKINDKGEEVRKRSPTIFNIPHWRLLRAYETALNDAGLTVIDRRKRTKTKSGERFTKFNDDGSVTVKIGAMSARMKKQGLSPFHYIKEITNADTINRNDIDAIVTGRQPMQEDLETGSFREAAEPESLQYSPEEFTLSKPTGGLNIPTREQMNAPPTEEELDQTYDGDPLNPSKEGAAPQKQEQRADKEAFATNFERLPEETKRSIDKDITQILQEAESEGEYIEGEDIYGPGIPTWATQDQRTPEQIAYDGAWKDTVVELDMNMEAQYMAGVPDNMQGMQLGKMLERLSNNVPEDSNAGILLKKLTELELTTRVRFVKEKELIRDDRFDGKPSAALYNDVADTIKLDPKLYNMGGYGLRVLLHEAVHSATVRNFENSAVSRKLWKDMLTNARKHSSPVKYKDGRPVYEHYGLTDEREFLAEALTNDHFQEFLNTVPVPKSNYKGFSITNLWKSFIKSVGESLGFTNVKEFSALEKTLWLVEDSLITQKTKDKMRPYWGIDNPMVAGWHGGRKLEGDKFNNEYIKTGTGGIVQGWGVYLAEKKSTSEYYKSLIDAESNQDWTFSFAGTDGTDIVADHSVVESLPELKNIYLGTTLINKPDDFNKAEWFEIFSHTDNEILRQQMLKWSDLSSARKSQVLEEVKDDARRAAKFAIVRMERQRIAQREAEKIGEQVVVVNGEDYVVDVYEVATSMFKPIGDRPRIESRLIDDVLEDEALKTGLANFAKVFKEGPLRDLYNTEASEVRINEPAPKGKLYRSQFDGNKEDLLSWDMDMEDQSEAVIEKLDNHKFESVIKPMGTRAGKKWFVVFDMGEDIQTGEKITWTEGPFDTDEKARNYVFNNPNPILQDSDFDEKSRPHLDGFEYYSTTGEDIYKRIAQMVQFKGVDAQGRKSHTAAYRAASSVLYNMGIPGNKYFDARSRRQQKGTENFVVFSDKEVKPTYEVENAQDDNGYDIAYITFLSSLDAQRDPGTLNRMTPTDTLKSKKIIEKFTETAELNGVKVYTLWEGNESLPDWAGEGLDKLVAEGNWQVLGNKHGWINSNTREIVLFPKNIENVQMVKETIWHEAIGHLSMEEVFGNDYVNMMTSLADHKNWKGLVDKKIAEQQTNGIELSRYDAAREVVAEMAQSPKTPTMFRRVVAWLKHQLRKRGLAGNWITEADMQAYIAKAAKVFNKGEMPTKKQMLAPSMGNISNFITATAPDKNTREESFDYANRLRDVYWHDFLQSVNSGWASYVDGFWRKVSRAKPFRHYGTMKAMMDPDAYNALRQQGLGLSSEYDQLAQHVYESFKDLSQEQKTELSGYLTARDISVESLNLTQEQKALAVQTKEVIRDLGSYLVEKGALAPETFEANEFAYLPRKYAMYLLEDKEAGGKMGGSSKVSFMDYVKQRNPDLSEDAMRLLGVINDPALLASSTIGSIGRDVALLDMFETISDISYVQTGKDPWMLPKTATVDTPFGRMDAIGAILFAQDRRRKLGDDPILVQMERDARRLLAERTPGLYEVDVNDYKQVPSKSKREGAFGGRWIRKEIYNDITASAFALAPDDPSVMEKMLGQYGYLTKANRAWKGVKTVFNPPTHARNWVGNFINLDISTSTPAHKLFGMIGEELGRFSSAKYSEDEFNIKDMEQFPIWWKIAQEGGITETTFAAKETLRAIRGWQRAFEEATGGENWTDHIPGNMGSYMKDNFPAMQEKMTKFLDGHKDFYQFSETLFKVVKLRDDINRFDEGQRAAGQPSLQEMYRDDPAQAKAISSTMVADAQKWIFDYSNVPRWIEYLRNAPIGAPFISFTYLAMPRQMEGALKHPAKFLKYATLPWLVGSMFAGMGWLGDDDDDWDTIRAQLPAHLKDKHFVAPLPFKDPETGEIQVTDLGYYMPMQPGYELARSYIRMARGKDLEKGLVDPILDLGVLSGPVPSTLSVLLTGIDPFTGRKVMDEYGSASDKLFDVLNYSWTVAGPTYLTSMGALGKAVNLGQYHGAIPGTANNVIDPITGRPKYGMGEVAGRMAGLNVYRVDRGTERVRNLRHYQSELRKKKTYNNKEIKKARTNGATIQTIAKMRRDATEQERIYRDQLQRYARESTGGERE